MDDTQKPTEIEVVAWARLLKASAKLLAFVERDLKEAGLPPLAWYDALLELYRARPDGLRRPTLIPGLGRASTGLAPPGVGIASVCVTAACAGALLGTQLAWLRLSTRCNSDSPTKRTSTRMERNARCPAT